MLRLELFVSGLIELQMGPKPGGLEEKYIIPILREVAEALGWVHRAGIIHRDVKCKLLWLRNLSFILSGCSSLLTALSMLLVLSSPLFP